MFRENGKTEIEVIMMDVTLQVPLGEQMHLKEMFSVLEENHMEIESQNLENFFTIL